MKNKTPLILTPNKDVSCGYSYSKSHYSINPGASGDDAVTTIPETMSIHEQRVILKTIEIIGAQLEGLRLDTLINTQVEPSAKTYEITMPIRDVFFNNLPLKQVEDELLHLLGRQLHYEDKEKDISWHCTFIEHPEINRGKGTFSYGIYQNFAKFLLNFQGGFKRFEINKALGLPTAYAMRFYILMSGETRPYIEMSVEEFKEWLNISDNKYRDKKGNHRIDNIEKAVIIPSKEALDEKCPWSFTYTKVKEDANNPRSKVVAFRFFPVEHKDNRDPELEKDSILSKIMPSFVLSADIKDILTKHYGFTTKDLNTHKATILEWGDYEDLNSPENKDCKIEWLRKKYKSAQNAEKGPVAYIAGSMYRRIKELKAKRGIIDNPNINPGQNVDSSTHPEKYINGFLQAVNNHINAIKTVLPPVPPTKISDKCKERFIARVQETSLQNVLEVINHGIDLPYFQERHKLPNGEWWTPSLTWMLDKEHFYGIATFEYDKYDFSDKKS